MTFSAKSLLPYLPALGKANRCWIAYSGGLDSHVLLHAMHELAQNPLTQQAISYDIAAIHINHGLSPNADYWQAHCQKICKELSIPLTAKTVCIDQQNSSIEAQARSARYTEFSQILNTGEYLLMAHHQDDQLETILFRLLRGSGPRGLAAIPIKRNLASGQLIRPLLHVSRIDLVDYAEAHKLKWIEDESNQEIEFDRNFLRLQVLPLLQQRWPNFANNWQRSAQLCYEADQLQSILGEQDLELVKGSFENRLDIQALAKFSQLRQRNILRVWFDQLQNKYQLPLPGFQLLEHILSEVVSARDDASPLVCWSADNKQVEVRRFANELYVLRPIVAPQQTKPLVLIIGRALTLSESLGTLSLKKVKSHGLDLSSIKQLQVTFRQGGEKIKPAGRKRKSLKKIFQDYGIPPWLRDKVPLIYIEDDLVAVADLCISENRIQEEGQNLYQICWSRPDIHCGY